MNKKIKVNIDGWVPVDEDPNSTINLNEFKTLIEEEFYGTMYRTKAETKNDGIVKAIYRRFKVTVNIEVEDFEKKPLKSKKGHAH